jgi:hypothetical protein
MTDNDCKYLRDELGFCKRQKQKGLRGYVRFTPKWFCYKVCQNYKPKKINLTRALANILPLVIALGISKQIIESTKKKKLKGVKK